MYVVNSCYPSEDFTSMAEIKFGTTTEYYCFSFYSYILLDYQTVTKI